MQLYVLNEPTLNGSVRRRGLPNKDAPNESAPRNRLGLMPFDTKRLLSRRLSSHLGSELLNWEVRNSGETLY